MKKTKNLYIYSVALIVVAMAFIVIGGISLSKNVTKEDNGINMNFSAKDKVIALNDENARLLKENKELSKKTEELEAENKELSKGWETYNAVNSVLEAEAMIESGDIKNAKILLERINPEYIKGFITKKYETLLETVKENTND